MKEAFEKIKERLEEEAENHRKYWSEFGDEDSFGAMNATFHAQTIVSEVEAEYGKDINVRGNGWITDRMPTEEEYNNCNGQFIVSDGNRTYATYFDIYDTLKFGEPTMNGFRIDRCVIAWMPLPEAYKPEKGV